MTDRERAMAEMYLSGRPLREVGEAFGLSRQRVQQILKKLNVARRPRGCERIPLPMDEVRAWRAAGETWVSIAERLGCGLDTVRQRAIKCGVPEQGYRFRAKERKTCDKSDPVNVRISELTDAGKSLAQIAAEVGLCRNSIANRMVACGIDPAHEARVQKRRSNDRNDPWNKEIARLMNEGKRPAEIASAIGVNAETVKRRIMICDIRPGEAAA